MGEIMRKKNKKNKTFSSVGTH